MSSHHVFVVAISVFNRQKHLSYTKYIYEDYTEEQSVDKVINPDHKQKKNNFECYGYYQLSPIPKFIKDYLETDITDVILLETAETQKAESIILKEWNSDLGEKPIECQLDTQNVSPVEFYKGYLRKLFNNQDLKFHEILVNPKKDNNNDKEPYGLTDTAKQLFTIIENLYNDQDNTNNWRLWFDTHGGFRDLNMVIASTARLLAIQDGKTVITNGIYSVYHSQNNGDNKDQEKKNFSTDYIKDQTAFYFADSTEGLAKFLNYGQYIARNFTPYIGDEPYCFVSYRHDINYLNSVRSLFHLFEENNINYWFDQDIRDGEKWDEKLRDRNENATVFVLLYTESYLLSSECWKELIRFIINTKVKFNKDLQEGHVTKDGLKDYYQSHFKIISFTNKMIFPENFSIPSAINPTEIDKDFNQKKFDKDFDKMKAQEEKTAKEKGVTFNQQDLKLVFSTDIQKICFWKYQDNDTEVSTRNTDDEQIIDEIRKINDLLSPDQGHKQ